jgi:hypothetical protein
MADFGRMAKQFLSLNSAAKNGKDRAEQIMGGAISGLEVGSSAFLLSYLNGRAPAVGKDHHEVISGVPTDLSIAIAGHLLAAFGMFGRFGEHAHNVANGGVGTYAARMGYKMGVDNRIKAIAPKNSTQGVLSMNGKPILGETTIHHAGMDQMGYAYRSVG